MSRPGHLVAVVGTGTEVGKTWVAARLLAAWRDAGLAVAARKPAQSAEPDDPGPSDAEVLAGASGEDDRAVCPPHRRYPVAMAPPMAAEAAGRPPFAVADLVGELAWPDPPVDVGLVETAGGLLSPAAGDGSGLDLVRALAPDEVLLVADAGLGTLHAVRSALAVLADDPWPVTVFLNRYAPAEPLHRANHRWLVEQDAVPALVDPADLAGRLAPTTRSAPPPVAGGPTP